jgi:hypothetical protein
MKFRIQHLLWLTAVVAAYWAGVGNERRSHTETMRQHESAEAYWYLERDQFLTKIERLRVELIRLENGDECQRNGQR